MLWLLILTTIALADTSPATSPPANTTTPDAPVISPNELPLRQPPATTVDENLNTSTPEHHTFDKHFAAHITTNAFTGEPGTVSLERSPGANINTDLLLMALSVVVYDRIEIGVVPAYYFEKEHKGNLLLKYNFWRSKEFFWTASAHHARFVLDSAIFYENITYNFDLNVQFNTVQLTMNYLPLNSPFSFGVSLAAIYTRLGLVFGTLSAQQVADKYESGLDASYALNTKYDITLGIGFLRESGLTAYERLNFGFGTSIRYKRESELFSSFTLGAHYTPKTEDVLYLFSTKVFSFD